MTYHCDLCGATLTPMQASKVGMYALDIGNICGTCHDRPDLRDLIDRYESGERSLFHQILAIAKTRVKFTN